LTDNGGGYDRIQGPYYRPRPLHAFGRTRWGAAARHRNGRRSALCREGAKHHRARADQAAEPGCQPGSTKPIERRTPRQAADDAISTRICIGCRPDPGSTGSLPEAGPAPVKRDVQLDELRTLAEPRQQSDLDTLPLASAHREQARSAQEKTDGLWQSWLVSVCDGCGDQRPARALRLEDWPNRAAAGAPVVHDRKAVPTRVRATDIVPHRSLAADLSPENVTSIRRMP
jgi:hypothetical protein